MKKSMSFETHACRRVYVTWAVVVGMLTVGIGGRQFQTKEQFSQKEAAIVMVGMVSAEALLMPGGIRATDENDVKEYLQVAQFNKPASTALFGMLKEQYRRKDLEKPGQLGILTEQDRRNMEEHGQRWNTMNGLLTSEARRVSPGKGAEWLSFGISLQFVNLGLAASQLQSHAITKELKLKLVRTILSSPIGRDLFTTGRKLPLPDKLRTALDSAEGTDTSTLEGCALYTEHIGRVVRMTKAVMRQGPSSLNRFPDQ